ncbi:MAG: aminoglycoside phosphotransferase family protein [Pseudomonadales bacterium]
MTNSNSIKTNNTTNSLRAWCEQQLATRTAEKLVAFQALSGDASFRKYHRLNTENNTYIAVFAPPETEKNSEFVQIARLLGDAGLRVPEVIAVDLEQGFLLQSDLGDTLLLSQLNSDTVDHWYSSAMQALITLQQIDTDGNIGQYSATQMREDLERFPQWFVQGLLDHSMSAHERELFDQFCEQLLSQALAQPQALTHYDYQSRNLMICADNELGIIDFQDALLAPITYDLVSLLRDCYVKWPQQQVMAWLHEYASLAKGSGLLAADVNETQLTQWFDYMSLQRHVRVLGTFARLHLRDSKPAYLNDIPLVCRYVQEVAASHSELSAFAQWFEQVLMPKAISKDWFKPIGHTS